MTKIEYTKGWFNYQKRALERYSTEEAYIRFKERKPLTAIIYAEDNVNPFCYIDINNTYINVYFLDKELRQYLSYEFNEISKGKLFLKEVFSWEYIDDSDQKSKSERYRFTVDGYFGIEKKDFIKKEAERLECEKKIDISSLYDDYPEFDNYDNLIQQERDINTSQ